MRNSTNKSIIEKHGKQYLKNTIEKSSSMSDVLREYGLSTGGSASRDALKRLCLEWDISLVFTKPRKSSRKDKCTFEEIFCKNSKVAQTTLRKTVIKDNLLDNTKCSICGIKNIWNNKLITMILDHINGINKDNRINNLRFVCPNCNSQLRTTGSRNKKNNLYKKKIYKCKDCGKIISQNSSFCSECNYINRRKVKRPTEKKLKEDLSEMSYRSVGKKYGVSDNSIRKWLKYYEKRRKQ